MGDSFLCQRAVFIGAVLPGDRQWGLSGVIPGSPSSCIKRVGRRMVVWGKEGPCPAVDARSFLRRNGHGLRPPSVAASGKKRSPPPYPLLPQNPHIGKTDGTVHGDAACAQRYSTMPKGNGSGMFSGTVSRATVKHHRAMPQAWPCFFHMAPSGGDAFSLFTGSHQKTARKRRIPYGEEPAGITALSAPHT